MSRFAWAQALVLLRGLYLDEPDTWPQRLAPTHLARLQSPPRGKDWTDTRAMQAAIEQACTAGELAHVIEAFTLPPPVAWARVDDPPGAVAARYRAQATVHEWRAICAADFLSWLKAERVEQGEHIKAWAEAMGAADTQLAPPKSVQRQAAHEAAIIDALRRHNFDPLRLPPSPPGKASLAKQAARTALPNISRAAFDKAWLRLRADERIADA